MLLVEQTCRVRAVLVLIMLLGARHGFFPNTAAAQGIDASFRLEEAASVADAVSRIRTTLETQGATIVAIIDHAAAASSVGLTLSPTTVLLFRQPMLEERLLRRSQTVGIDLPQKLLVWQDATGAIRLNFNSPSYVAQRHGITWHDQLLEEMRDGLEQFDDDTGLSRVQSARSVDNTVAALQLELQRRGFAVRPVINHSAGAAPGQARMRPTKLLIFGNPTAGTRLMQNRQTIGIDLPLKFLVWEDRRGRVFITHNDMHFLARRHGVEGIDALLATIATTLKTVAEIGAGRSLGTP